MTQPFGNQLVLAILRSPLHAVLGPGFASIEFVGSRSGRPYSVPVNVIQDGDGFLIISRRHRTWWRNLRSSPIVALRYRGQARRLRAEAIEAPEVVAELLRGHLKLRPRHARYFGISIDTDGRPNPEALARAAEERVFVRLRPV